jgi:hypothetical protein
LEEEDRLKQELAAAEQMIHTQRKEIDRWITDTAKGNIQVD